MTKHQLLCQAGLQILEQKGPQGLTFSAVSRKAGISRPWIYKYIGNKQSDILDFIISEIGKEVGMMHGPWRDLEGDSVLEALQNGFTSLLSQTGKNPVIFRLFLKYSADPGPVGTQIRKLMGEYSGRLAKRLKTLGLRKHDQESKDLAELVGLLRMGIVGFATHSSLKKYSEEELISLIDDALYLVRGGYQRKTKR